MDPQTFFMKGWDIIVWVGEALYLWDIIGYFMAFAILIIVAGIVLSPIIITISAFVACAKGKRRNNG